MDPIARSLPNTSDELRAVLRLLRRTARKWRPGAVVFAAVAVIAAGVILFWPKQYRSEAVVYYRVGMQWTSGEAPNSQRMGQRFKDSLLARTLLTKVIEETGLFPRLRKSGRMAEAVEEMRLAIGFRIDQGDVYTLSFTGDSPAEAQRVTAKLTEKLIAENARLQNDQAQEAQTFLEDEKQRTEADLAAKEGVLLRFVAKHPEFAAEQNAMGGSLLRSRQGPASPLSEHDNDALAALRREEERLRRQLSSAGQTRPPQDPTLVMAKEDAETKLRAAQRDLAEKRANFTEEHPDVRAAAALAKAAAEAYKRALGALTAAEPAVINDRLAQVQQEIATFRRLQGPVRPALPDPSRNSEAARRVVTDEAEWARLNREATEARERFQQLEARQFVASMTANMAAGGQASQIVVIDPAFLPAQPVGTSRTGRALVGLLLALVSGMGVAVVLALYDDRILEALDVERLQLGPVLLEIGKSSAPQEAPANFPGSPSPVALLAGPGGGSQGRPMLVASTTPAPTSARIARTGQAIVGAVTALQAPAPDASPPTFVRVHHVSNLQSSDPRLVMLNAPGSTAAAAYRVLRHRLRERGNPRTIAVTSPNRGEGKSFCAVNLALALVEGERARAVLLEANFHSPFVAKLFGFEPPVCAGEQLEAHRQRPSQIWEAVETVVPSLHTVAIAPGSTIHPTLDGTLSLFVAAFRLAGYDYVVIDGPDALGSADVTLMQESIDGMLMSVRGGVSSARAIRSAIGQIGGRKLLGFTLFDV